MSAPAIDDFDAARAAVNAGTSPTDAARGLVAQMSPEERLWCLDGDLPGLTGLMFIGLEDGYHRAPFFGAVVGRLGLPGIAFADGPRVGPVQQHLLPGVDGPGGDLGSTSRGAGRSGDRRRAPRFGRHPDRCGLRQRAATPCMGSSAGDLWRRSIPGR